MEPQPAASLGGATRAGAPRMGVARVSGDCLGGFHTVLSLRYICLLAPYAVAPRAGDAAGEGRRRAAARQVDVGGAAVGAAAPGVAGAAVRRALLPARIADFLTLRLSVASVP